MFGGNAKLKALENELRLTKLKLGEVEEERDDLKNLTLELQKVLSKMTKDVKVRENENDEKVRYVFFFNFFSTKDLLLYFFTSITQTPHISRTPRYKLKKWRRNAFEQRERRT